MSASDQLSSLCHRRWSISLLAELHRQGGGAKFITLRHRLGIGPTTLSATLDHLIRHGWVMRNPGHGHPMRPEYILPDAAQPLGQWSDRVDRTVDRLGVGAVAFRKWSLPTILAIHRGGQRFAEIQSALPRITDRALALALRHLQQVRLLDRTVFDARPPLVEYQLIGGRGTRLGRSLASLPLA